MIHKLARHQERRSKEICFYFFHINTHPGEVRTEIVSEFFVEHDFPTRVQQNMRELMGESEATTSLRVGAVDTNDHRPAIVYNQPGYVLKIGISNGHTVRSNNFLNRHRRVLNLASL